MTILYFIHNADRMGTANIALSKMSYGWEPGVLKERSHIGDR